MTGPEFDPDLNPEYRAKAMERDDEQRVSDIQPPGLTLGLRGTLRRLAASGPRQGWLQKRQAKVAAEIERNRAGDYRVPTWVLTLILVAVIVGLVLLFTLV